MSFIKFSKKKFKKNKKLIQSIIFLFFGISIFFLLVSLFTRSSFLDQNSFTPKKTDFFDYDLEGEMLFNDLDGYETYSKTTLDILKNAKHSIQVAMYSINSPEIIEILDQKKREGIKAVVVTPLSKTKQHTLAFGITDIPLIQIGKSETDDETLGDLMHHKFILVDSGYETQTLVFGSSNLTFFQEKYDPSFLFTTQDAEIIKIFQSEFDFLKNQTHGVKKIFKNGYNPFAFRGMYTNGFVEIWFSPGYLKNSIKYRMIELIEQAQTNIKIIGWRINDKDIYAALVKKVREGVQVQIILDDYYMWDSNSIGIQVFDFKNNTDTDKLNITTDSYVHIKILKDLFGTEDNLKDTFNSFMHHHTLIIDDTILVTGTNNWGTSGFYHNDESIMVTDVKYLVKKYVNYFTTAYDMLHGFEIDVSLNKDDMLIINSDLSEDSNILIYIEKSAPDWVGELCFEISYKEYVAGIKIPELCKTQSTRIFITDQNYKVIGSGYLKL